MVGAVVVRDDRAVGAGFHARVGGEHAETAALREAGALARGAELYLNLEPCCYHRFLAGRAPTCVEQIVAAGIRRVVAASKDPNPGVDGRGFESLRSSGIEVPGEDPLFAAWGARFNEIFFKFIRTREPFVALKAGMSLDGRIALPTGESRWITGEAARTEAKRLRGIYQAVCVGIGTVLADDPLLLPPGASGAPGGAGMPPTALSRGDRRAFPEEARGADPDRPAARGSGPDRPIRIVLDTRLRISPRSRLVKSARETGLIVYGSESASAEDAARLEAAGAVVVRSGHGRPAIEEILSDLAARDVGSVLVEGGGEVLGAFLRSGKVDKLHLFASPRLIGGRDSVPVFGGEAPRALAEAFEVRVEVVSGVGGDLLIEAYPRGGARRDAPPGGAGGR